MSQSPESSHSSLHKHNRKWDVCGKGSGEGEGGQDEGMWEWAGPPTQPRAAQGGPGERNQVLSPT